MLLRHLYIGPLHYSRREVRRAEADVAVVDRGRRRRNPVHCRRCRYKGVTAGLQTGGCVGQGADVETHVVEVGFLDVGGYLAV